MMHHHSLSLANAKWGFLVVIYLLGTATASQPPPFPYNACGFGDIKELTLSWPGKLLRLLLRWRSRRHGEYAFFCSLPTLLIVFKLKSVG